MFISVDPGKNVGVATFNQQGVDIKHTIMREEEFRGFLANTYLMARQYVNEPGRLNFKIIFIMENYKLRQDKALDQLGSDMPASRIIGAVEMIDELLGRNSEIVLQEPGILNTALKWAGMSSHANRGRKYHVPDDISAYAHGVFYLIQQNIRAHPIFND